MKKALLIACIAAMPTLASAQAGGVTLNIDNQSPLSKWGRWTSAENGGLGYGFKLNQDRGRNNPMSAQWSSGDWVFKLSREEGSKRPDLFFGLKVAESQLQITSLGCMSDSGSTVGRNANRYSSTLCGVQLDMNLQ